MYPPLSTRRRILLALLILGGKSTYSVIKSFLPAGYSGPKFYAMLKRLEADGLVKRFHRPSSIVHRPSLRLLPAGIELLEKRYGPRIFRVIEGWRARGPRSSDRTPSENTSRGGGRRSGVEPDRTPTENWSLIILNFPTSQAYSRSRLTGRLIELGCGPLRDGVYISPYPILPAIAEWSEENNCLNRVFLSSIVHRPSSIVQLLAAWNLPALSRRYLSLLDRLGIAKGIALARKKHRAIQRIKSDFLDLVAADPLLPRDLLPPDYPLVRVIGEMSTQDKDISTSGIKIDSLSDKKSVKIAAKTQDNLSKKV